MRAIVLGGAGIIGSHLGVRLPSGRAQLVVGANPPAGPGDNADPPRGEPRYTFLEHDICKPIPLEGNAGVVFNLASPASPIDYAKLPLETLDVGSIGTRNALALARQCGAMLLMASTSEIY